jgi:hypothetical protein
MSQSLQHIIDRAEAQKASSRAELKAYADRLKQELQDERKKMEWHTDSLKEDLSLTIQSNQSACLAQHLRNKRALVWILILTISNIGISLLNHGHLLAGILQQFLQR